MSARPDKAPSAGTVLYLFDTTHAAMEAEELIIDSGFWCDMVPRPPGTAATLCGLAIEALDSDEKEISRLLEDGSIRFETYRPGGADGS